jgi:hypothetical protein
MDPRPDPPHDDHDEREQRRRLLRRLEGSSRSPFHGGNLPRALRAVSIALALLGLAAWWMVSQEQKRLAEEAMPEKAPAAAAPSAGATGKSPAADASTSGAANTTPHPAGSFDRERARPLDRDRPDGR